MPSFATETSEDLQTSPFAFAMNSIGGVLYTADMTGATTANVAIVVDSGAGPVVIAREGDAECKAAH